MDVTHLDDLCVPTTPGKHCGQQAGWVLQQPLSCVDSVGHASLITGGGWGVRSNSGCNNHASLQAANICGSGHSCVGCEQFSEHINII